MAPAFVTINRAWAGGPHCCPRLEREPPPGSCGYATRPTSASHPLQSPERAVSSRGRHRGSNEGERSNEPSENRRWRRGLADRREAQLERVSRTRKDSLECPDIELVIELLERSDGLTKVRNETRAQLERSLSRPTGSSTMQRYSVTTWPPASPILPMPEIRRAGLAYEQLNTAPIPQRGVN